MMASSVVTGPPPNHFRGPGVFYLTEKGGENKKKTCMYNIEYFAGFWVEGSVYRQLSSRLDILYSTRVYQSIMNGTNYI